MTDSIQEQLIAARKNQILDAAVKVFAEKGFHRATIKDVARQAGIADGTIYNYFENKTALMLGLLDRLNQTEQRESDLAQSLEMGLPDFMNHYLRQRFEFITAQGIEVFQTILSEVMVNPELREKYWTQIVQPTLLLGEKYGAIWMDQTAIKPEDASLIMRLVSSMFLGAIMLRLMGDDQLKERWHELPDLMTQIILNGVLKD